MRFEYVQSQVPKFRISSTKNFKLKHKIESEPYMIINYISENNTKLI